MRRLLLVLPLVLVGCGTTSQGAAPASSGSATPTATTAPAITIKSFAYQPDPVVVKVGTTITIVNKDPVGHSVTTTKDAPAAYDSTVFTTGTQTFTPMTPGTYSYLCSVHTYMKGTIYVLP